MNICLTSTILLLVFDALWLSFNKQRYNILVKRIQGKSISINYIGALLAYILMIIGLCVFVIPAVKKSINKLRASVIYGGLFGLCVYGIFNATNYAIFDNYDIGIAIIDTLWGITIYSLVPFITLLLSQ